MAEPHLFLIALGKAVRQARAERHLSQEELGFRSGVHRNYIGGLERAERHPSVVTIVQLAEALDVTPSELMARAEGLLQGIAEGIDVEANLSGRVIR